MFPSGTLTRKVVWNSLWGPKTYVISNITRFLSPESEAHPKNIILPVFDLGFILSVVLMCNGAVIHFKVFPG